MTGGDPACWADRLNAAIADSGGLFTKATVLGETDSTQDAARRLGVHSGGVIVALRQTAGRGRLGRRWHDTLDDGLAATLVISADDSPRLAVAAAVAVAEAIETTCPGLRGRVGLKWPNDVIIDSRKVAGILIERAGGLAHVGIGINVHQQRWPAELAGVAVSLAQAGARVERIDLAVELIASLASVLTQTDERLINDFGARDVLCGRLATVGDGGRSVTGTIVRIDPMSGLLLRDEAGDTWVPAATARILAYSPGAARVREVSSPLP